MLQILGYLLLFSIVFLLVKFGFLLILRCIAIGIFAFFLVGMITGALALLGFIGSDTAWTLSKWAFYIGTVINVIEVICHPFSAIADAWKEATEESSSRYGSSSSSTSSSSGNGSERENLYSGVRCCGNCRWNKSPYGNNVICSHNPAGQYNGVMDRCIDYC